jgi:hypothetical protein
MTTGEDVLRVTAAVADEVLGGDLDAVFALGSLAHGGFAPLVSDVDVALVLRYVTAASAGRVAAVARRVREELPGPLSDRLSLFWADWQGVLGGGDVGRLPAVDRLDLLDSGRLLHGTDRRPGAVRPTANELVRQAAVFATVRFDRAYLRGLCDAGRLLAQGVRPVTKTVLFPVRFLHTVESGRIGRNDEAVGSYRGPSAPLVQAALDWRTTGITDVGGARALLEAHLVPLHLEFLDAYAEVAPALRVRRQELANMGC